MTSMSSLAQSSRRSLPPDTVAVPVTIRVEHALDLGEVEAVRAALSAALADPRLAPGGTVVLEMSGCDFVDMIGHRLLHEAAGTVQERGLVLHLSGVRPDVVRILGRLDQLLPGPVQQHIVACPSTGTPCGAVQAERHPEPRQPHAAGGTTRASTA